MATLPDELKRIGWNDWLEQQLSQLSQQNEKDSVARIAAVDREQFLAIDESEIFRTKLSGSYLHHHQQKQDFPCVGDWVLLEKRPGDEFGIIHTLLPRRTALRRKSAGTIVDYQMIAANIDHVIIVQSCHFDFNVKRLERYLVMVQDSGAEPHILLTKTDLVGPAILSGQQAKISAAGITAPLSLLSNLTCNGINEFRQMLQPGKTYCFVGSSGVGKSTLINHLLGQDTMETRTVSDTGEGRHTTVRRELIRLEGGALVIDTPGMRELGIIGTENLVESSYTDISTLASRCRFRNCTHSGEPGCAVQAALDTGDLSPNHLDNYRKLKEESSFYQMSHAEKRKKDRDFGKMVKSVKKKKFKH